MKRPFAVLVAACISLSADAGHAFNEPTHREMNRRATEGSALDACLRNELAFPLGLQSRFKGSTIPAFTVPDWTAEGGAREDDFGSANPLEWRFNRHFHDPLQPWTNAGLKGVFDSSVVWMQEPQDSMGAPQGWSWQEARSFYYSGLTSQLQPTRDQSFADTFRAVGQIMHLIEDAASPAHVRGEAWRM